MTALLGFILSNPTVIAIIGGIAAALGWGWKQRHAGAAKERAKQDRARIEAMTEAQKIDEAIAGRDPDENRKEFRKW